MISACTIVLAELTLLFSRAFPSVALIMSPTIYKYYKIEIITTFNIKALPQNNPEREWVDQLDISSLNDHLP